MNANKNHFSSKIDGPFWPLSVVSFRHRRTLTWMCQSKRSLQIDRAHFKLHLNQQCHATQHYTASKDVVTMIGDWWKVSRFNAFQLWKCHSTKCSSDNACPIFAQQIAVFRWNLHGCECIQRTSDAAAESKIHFIAVMCVKLEIQMWKSWVWIWALRYANKGLKTSSVCSRLVHYLKRHKLHALTTYILLHATHSRCRVRFSHSFL